VSLVLDAGALLAIDRRDRQVGALARTLAGVAAPPLDLATGKRLGLLLGATDSCDVVDAHIASLAQPGDQVLTSEPHELRHLLDALSVDASVVCV
jgi:hypothetical protein